MSVLPRCCPPADVLRARTIRTAHAIQAPVTLSFSTRLAAFLVLLLSAVQPAEADEPFYAHLFTRAFSPDYVATADDALPGEAPRPTSIFFRVSEPGTLKITSGRVVVADPFVGIDQQPLSVRVPDGLYPVRLAVLQGTMGRGRIAFARVDISNTPVVRWEAAKPEDMQRDAENPSGDWGFSVDSGIAGFFDVEAGQAALEAVKANDSYFDKWLEKGQNAGARERDTAGAFRLAIDSGPANVIAFDAGWGDGVYGAYAGYDAEGRLAALIADFDILDWSRVKE